MSDVELDDSCYLDDDHIGQNQIPRLRPTEEVLERLFSQSLFQHWRFDDGAPVRQVIAFPVSPRTMEDGSLAADVFRDATCDILIEMADGRIAGFRFDTTATFKLTGDLFIRLANRLAVGIGQNEKPLPAHLTPYTSKRARRICKALLENVSGSKTEKYIGSVADCTREIPDISSLANMVGKIRDQLFLFEAYTDQFEHIIDSNRMAEVILSGLNGFNHVLRENVTGAFKASHFWAVLHNYLSAPEPVIRRNRRQAYELLPLPIIDLLTKENHGSTQQWHVARHIDVGHSPYDVFSGMYLVKKGTLRDYSRSLGQMGLPECVERGGEYTRYYFGIGFIPQLIFSFLDVLSPTLRPRTPDEWFSFCDWESFFENSLTWRKYDRLSCFLREVTQHGWVSVSDWIQKKYGVDGKTAKSNIIDYQSAIVDYFRIISPKEGAFIILNDLTIRKLVHGSQLWHQAVTQVNNEYLRALQADDSTGEGWTWPLPPAFELSGYRIHALCDARSLVEEGAAMEHCVSTMTGQCFAGQSRVFSLKTASGCRCSTFDVKFTRAESGELSIHLREHQGYKNRPPEVKWCEVVKMFVEWLKLPAQQNVLSNDEKLGHVADITEWADGQGFFDPGMWIGFEAIRRRKRELGLDKYFPAAPIVDAEHQHPPSRELLNITYTSPQPALQLLLEWMLPALPTTQGKLRWHLESPNEEQLQAHSDFHIIICDFYHDESTTLALAQSFIESGQDVCVLMPVGADVSGIAKHGVFVLTASLMDERPADSISNTILTPAVEEGHICIDWADVRCLFREGGVGRIYSAIGENIQTAALNLLARMGKVMAGRRISGVFFVLPSGEHFMERIFQPAVEILSRNVPQDAVLLYAAPYTDPSHNNQISAFVVYN